ncbi:hypothetical protein LR48_Vigan05g044600 [Vigna angularis]|uniref:E3 ubiquitin-protein ligase RMA n=1 Tax=Phaseolus angularis TaxID=3914 RepID=A0A0L9UJU0_PHAAN|nr:E3 ubiquitin-protein ligase RMA3 [Vigna angularis]KOM42842.1 hypothetical protein LR48_Vigan05g044600 [Vigna angularis]
MEVDLNEDLDGIKERLRRLEGAAFRARQRQRRRLSHAPIQIVKEDGEVVTVAHLQDEETVPDGDFEGEIIQETEGKRKASYLVADALGLRNNEGEGFPAKLFHCNVCLKRAKDPVLTCCGHLFCWPCFHNLPLTCTYAKAKQCPVCEGQVTNESLTTIYGNSDVHDSGNLKVDEQSHEIPPRPCSRRVESIRQQLRN